MTNFPSSNVCYQEARVGMRGDMRTASMMRLSNLGSGRIASTQVSNSNQCADACQRNVGCKSAQFLAGGSCQLFNSARNTSRSSSQADVAMERSWLRCANPSQFPRNSYGDANVIKRDGRPYTLVRNDVGGKAAKIAKCADMCAADTSCRYSYMSLRNDTQMGFCYNFSARPASMTSHKNIYSNLCTKA